ncbi:hypothetical protein NXT3_PB00311 (plasmid) [Sinorhizobium fredii]|uniref:Uncharacterized protein n=1 Tax=Rhizobium fredii TaxID=380 RepID=A0A2L0HC36_RHIFR|nr:hypothetical protein NXT3_PB00311 [Sinorhizobium fredii]
MLFVTAAPNEFCRLPPSQKRSQRPFRMSRPHQSNHAEKLYGLNSHKPRFIGFPVGDAS